MFIIVLVNKIFKCEPLFYGVTDVTMPQINSYYKCFYQH